MATGQSFPALCTKDCGFFGSPDTGGMCSRCFRIEQGQQGGSSSDNGEQQGAGASSSSTGPGDAYRELLGAVALPSTLSSTPGQGSGTRPRVKCESFS